MPPGFTRRSPSGSMRMSAFAVREAEHGETIESGASISRPADSTCACRAWARARDRARRLAAACGACARRRIRSFAPWRRARGAQRSAWCSPAWDATARPGCARFATPAGRGSRRTGELMIYGMPQAACAAGGATTVLPPRGDRARARNHGARGLRCDRDRRRPVHLRGQEQPMSARLRGAGREHRSRSCSSCARARSTSRSY